MTRLVAIAILLGVLLGCSDDPYEGTKAEERGKSWTEAIRRIEEVETEDLTIDRLSDIIQELGGKEPLTVSSSGQFYWATLETVRGDDLPCGYADMRIAAWPGPNNVVDSYGISLNAICIASDANSQ